MVKQYRVKITYNDDTQEEYLIHSNDTVEWVAQQKQKTVDAFLTLFSSTNQVRLWFQQNNAKKLVISDENE